MSKVYAIGDIHGDYDKLVDIHGRIARDHGGDDARIIHVGDLVDRRFKANETIQFLIDGQAAGKPWVTLFGNHDRLFLRFLDDLEWRDPILRPDFHWLNQSMGGRTTLASYGVQSAEGEHYEAIQAEAREKVPAEHREFLANLPLYHLDDDILFVHAGIKPGVPLDRQVEDDLIWIRKPFHDYQDPHPHLIIHGHSVIDDVTHYGNRVNIDTGCAYGHDLSAVVIEDGLIWVLDEEGRRALPDLTRQ